MSCGNPSPTLYIGSEFDQSKRPMVVAALLSADNSGVIAAPDGMRWFQRDLNELSGRNWAKPHKMRADYLWTYKLTEVGKCVAESFVDEGYAFDGWDLWLGEEIIR